MALKSAPADTAVVRVTGEDAAAFLQGQCSADLRNAPLVDALWLNRKGRVLAHTVIAKEADGSFLLLCPHLSAAELIAIVTANVIADDVVATEESAQWQRVVVWGEGSVEVLTGGRLFSTRRFGVTAWEVLAPAEVKLPWTVGVFAELDALRISAGVPSVPADCGAHEFPQECGLDAWVSYTRQELKSLEGKVVGTVRSAAGDTGLALVSVDLPEGTSLVTDRGPVLLGVPALMSARP
ncbi:MAG: hypothetical protein EBU04_07945 [Verrucomicrobia bacterium]|nr:hypothetical protein [Verrucomicrobiota bacterium]